jgi:hypothetical protein
MLALLSKTSCQRGKPNNFPPSDTRFLTGPILILVLGIGLSYLGFGPFSLKKNPTAGGAVAVVGLLFRLAGSLLLVWGVFLWLFVISMTR